MAALPPPTRTRFGSPPLNLAEPGAESSPGKRKGRSARSSAGGAGGGNPRNFTRKRRCGGRARSSRIDGQGMGRPGVMAGRLGQSDIVGQGGFGTNGRAAGRERGGRYG